MELQIESKEVYDLRKERDIYNDYKDKFFRKLEKLKTANDKEGIKKLLNDKSEEEWKNCYEDYLRKIEERIKDINVKSGFHKYGDIKNNYILIKGSVTGTNKRAVVLTEAMRPRKRTEQFEILSLNLNHES
jgi:ribosomal protein L3